MAENINDNATASGGAASGVEPQSIQQPAAAPQGQEGQGGEQQKQLSYETYRDTVSENKKLKAKLKAFEDQTETQRQAKLKEDGKFQELIIEKDQKLSKMTEGIKLKEVQLLLSRSGVRDPEYALILMNRIEFDENLSIANADQVIADLKEKKPFLFGEEPAAQPPKPTVTAPGNIPGFKPGSAGVFNVKQIQAMPADEFQKHWPEIQKAMQEGKVKY